MEITVKSKEQKNAEAGVDDFSPGTRAVRRRRRKDADGDDLHRCQADGHPIIFANASFLALTGYDREEVLGKQFNSLLAVGIDGDALATSRRQFARNGSTEPEIHYRRKDGSEFWASIFISPVCDENDTVVQHFVSLVDLTRHKQDNARGRMMIDELNHRVKNTLSTVQSIVTQALRRPSEPAEIREAIESRILALSRSHDLLTSSNWHGAGLHDLVDTALEPFEAVAGRDERFTIRGDNVQLPAQTTLSLAIALHELATNAVKYGAFSNDAGTIAIDWAVVPGEDGERLLLRWIEQGGPPVPPPTHKGFGSWVIERGLAHELGGKVSLDYLPRGSPAGSTSRRPRARRMTGPLSGRSILVVEDEMLVLMHIETALSDLGCTAISVGTISDAALTVLDGASFDAAMLDVNLHGEKSYPVADALARRGIPFVFSTGYGDHGDRPDFADRPMLRKPYLQGHLVAALSALVAPKKRRAAARCSSKLAVRAVPG